MATFFILHQHYSFAIVIFASVLERYPSGHKGTHSKCVRRREACVGSNPTLSAIHIEQRMLLLYQQGDAFYI